VFLKKGKGMTKQKTTILNARGFEAARFLRPGGGFAHPAGPLNSLQYPIYNLSHRDSQSTMFSSPSSPARAAWQQTVRTAFVFVLFFSVTSVPSVAKNKPFEALRTVETQNFASLLYAIEQVESNGRTDAIGDSGKAAGCLQIHKIMVDDVNRILSRTEFTYADRLSRQKSFAMARIYLNHYGKGKSIEQQARIWNGGPNGHKKQSTLQYAAKVNNVAQASRLSLNKPALRGQSNG
jgi:hypothetical protein